MKRIETQGITYIEPLDGSCGEWYWGSDYASGDRRNCSGTDTL